MNKLIKLLPHKIRYSKMLEELEETYNREFNLMCEILPSSKVGDG